MDPNRHPEGTPAGGRFAPDPHAEDAGVVVPIAKELDDDIPTSVAWRQGRRVYVRCGYRSQLNGEMRDLGARWDRDERALWIGSAKAEAVVPLVAASLGRAAETETTKAAGHWVTIPYAATDLRAQAKAAGARWDRDRKQWAMPDASAATTVADAVTTWTEAKAAETKTAKAHGAKTSAVATTAEVVASSGRTVISTDPITTEGRLTGVMRRPAAEATAPAPGDVIHTHGDHRVLVTEVEVDFWDHDYVEDFSPGSEVGWRWSATGVEVEPTNDELAVAEVRAARAAEATEVSEVLAAARATPVTMAPGGRLTQRAGATITVRGASGTGRSNGTLTVTDDGALWWSHPGHYDDWIAVEGQVTDSDLARRATALTVIGPRTVAFSSRGRTTTVDIATADDAD